MMGKRETLPTLWEVPDDLWQRIEPVILELDPPKPKGRKRVDQRKMLEGVIFRMRSSCQWNHLPRELGMTAPSTGPSGVGWNVGCWRGSGPC